MKEKSHISVKFVITALEQKVTWIVILIQFMKDSIIMDLTIMDSLIMESDSYGIH